MKYQIAVNGSQGYAANQVKSVTVGELKEMLADLEDDDTVVLYDTCTGYGASFGEITTYVEEVSEEE